MTIEETIAAAVAAEVRPVLEELRALRAALQPAPAVSSAKLTVEQVAAVCGDVTEETVRGWIHQKKLVASKAGGRYLVSREELERFLSPEPARKLSLVDDDEQVSRVMKRLGQGGSP